MNIDFIEASGIFTGKNTPFFGHLQEWSEIKVTGRRTYILEGCNKLKLYYTPSSGMLVLSGSIMYFIQGHNFTYDKHSFVSAIDYIGQLLNVNLWGMYLNILECGVILEVDQKPKDIIQHHREGKGMLMYENPKDKGHFRSFNDKLAERKMYDAGRNIKQKLSNPVKEIIKSYGWDPQGFFLKWEVHYINPEVSLNHGRGIRLCDLMNPHWEQAISQDIYLQYSRIIPMKSIIPPSDKSDLHALDIFAIELVEAKLNEGKTLAEIRKLLYARINASSVLSKADKDARKRKVKATLDKLEESKESAWDISQQLKEALCDSCSTSSEESGDTSTPFDV